MTIIVGRREEKETRRVILEMDKIELYISMVDIELVDDFFGYSLSHPELLQLVIEGRVQMERVTASGIRW